jgi:hypothetical protein
VAKFSDEYFKLQINQRLYVNALIILIVFLIGSTLLGLQYTKGILIIFSAYWIAAIYCDLMVLYKKIYESVLGKGFLLILFSLCTNFAVVLSSQLINDIVGVDPSKFPHTIVLLSILTIPFFIAVGCAILYVGFFLIFLIFPLLLMFLTMRSNKAKEFFVPGYCISPTIPYQKTTRTVQFISFAIFCAVVLGLSQKVARSYEAFLTNTARSFLYQQEMYPKAPCALDPDSRIAFLSDEKILVGQKGSTGIAFKIHECKSKN